MTPTNEPGGVAPGDEPASTPGPGPADLTQLPAPGSRRVLLVGADGALMALIEEWLLAEGCSVVLAPGDGEAAGQAQSAAAEPAPCGDLVIVDVPFPRQCGVDWIARLAQRYSPTPILALSSTFFAGVECCGPVARRLGVACVLPNPVSRAALVNAVQRLLRR